MKRTIQKTNDLKKSSGGICEILMPGGILPGIKG